MRAYVKGLLYMTDRNVLRPNVLTLTEQDFRARLRLRLRLRYVDSTVRRLTIVSAVVFVGIMVIALLYVATTLFVR